MTGFNPVINKFRFSKTLTRPYRQRVIIRIYRRRRQPTACIVIGQRSGDCPIAQIYIAHRIEQITIIAVITAPDNHCNASAVYIDSRRFCHFRAFGYYVRRCPNTAGRLDGCIDAFEIFKTYNQIRSPRQNCRSIGRESNAWATFLLFVCRNRHRRRPVCAVPFGVVNFRVINRVDVGILISNPDSYRIPILVKRHIDGIIRSDVGCQRSGN